MNTQELPLYSTKESIKQSNLPENKYSSIASNPYNSVESALKKIFPIQSEESKIIRIRRLLGETAKYFSDEELEVIITEFQYLIDMWLDSFEKEVFDGSTLSQLLKGK